jgi:hypothetical protein
LGLQKQWKVRYSRARCCKNATFGHIINKILRYSNERLQEHFLTCFSLHTLNLNVERMA